MTGQAKINFDRRGRKYIVVLCVLSTMLAGVAMTALLFGNTVYSPSVIWNVLQGEQVQGATFTIMSVRLPRMLSGLLCGFAFGAAGNVFQKLLGNQLASPDIIGVTAGSSVAAVFSILFLHLSGTIVSVIATISGLLVAGGIYLLSGSKVYGVSNSRLILTGIGVQAFLMALISWMLLKASEYDVAGALRWMSGSINNTALGDMPRLAAVVVICVIWLGSLYRHLEVIELGKETATTLGVNLNRTRLLLMFFSLLMISFATSVSGPIASVAFLSGPIANALAGRGRTNIVSSGLVGAVLVMSADLVAQYALPARYPVGVLTGILGAPYLIYLLVSYSRKVGQ